MLHIFKGLGSKIAPENFYALNTSTLNVDKPNQELLEAMWWLWLASQSHMGTFPSCTLAFWGGKKTVFVTNFFFSFLGPRSTLPGIKEQK